MLFTTVNDSHSDDALKKAALRMLMC